MNQILLIIITVVLYLIAYHTYGKYLSKKIFKIDPTRKCPSEVLRDDVDYIPTKKHILFGHHFTSIAGTGPIVGPAIAIIWGWFPAILWILIGSIFMGAVHDFGSMIISLRNKGHSIGDVASQVLNKRVRILFLIIIFLLLWIVIAIFGLVIAIVFNIFPQAVFPVIFQIPVAIWLGYVFIKKQKSYLLYSIIALVLMYISVYFGSIFPLKIPELFGISSVGIWTILLLFYAYIASTLPVQVLLQPRDFINAYQLLIIMGLLAIGVFVSKPEMVAPMINLSPEGAPPMWPMLFVVVACGAISGFHSLVSSGTSSKQCDNESNSLFVSYGSMLTEGLLAVFVIIACGAGIGFGLEKNGIIYTGFDAFSQHYSSWAAAQGLGSKINAFVTGSANMIEKTGIPKQLIITIMGVFVASFAATTLDTAARLQRYIVSEFARTSNIKFLEKKHPATFMAIITALALAFYNGTGKGALILWPLFGTCNQLLAAISLLVITVYLIKKGTSAIYTLIPTIFMLIVTGWAMYINLKTFYVAENWLLFVIGLIILILDIWIFIETCAIIKKKYFFKKNLY